MSTTAEKVTTTLVRVLEIVACVGALIVLFTVVPYFTGWSNNAPCRPAEPTHRVRCWSGGAVVWEELIHKAGGYRCNSQGLEVRYPTSGGLCIEEEIAWMEEAGGD